MTDLILLTVALTWVAIHAGTFYVLQSSILPLLNSRDKDAYLETAQGIDMRAFQVIALVGGAATVLLGAYLVTQLDETVAQVCTAIATAAFLIAGAISESTNHPIWRRVQNVWTPTSAPGDWNRQRQRWSTAHTLRTLATFVATVGFAVAIIVEFG